MLRTASNPHFESCHSTWRYPILLWRQYVPHPRNLSIPVIWWYRACPDTRQLHPSQCSTPIHLLTRPYYLFCLQLCSRRSICDTVPVNKRKQPELSFPILIFDIHLLQLLIFECFFCIVVLHWPIRLPSQSLLLNSTLRKSNVPHCMYCHCSQSQTFRYASFYMLSLLYLLIVKFYEFVLLALHLTLSTKC